jgi:transcription initiation factor TFIID subunit TAF12
VVCIDELSTYYLAHEISGVWQGLTIMLPETYWPDRFGHQTPAQLAVELRRIARTADPRKYRKRPTRATQRSTRAPCQPRSHVSTARILANATHE